MAQEKFAVRFSAEDRTQLEGLIRRGQHSARVINRARILLKTDESWSASQVAARWTRPSAQCSAPSGGTPRRDWTVCSTTIPRPTGIASWMIGAKPT